MAVIYLKPDRDRSVRRRHPWIFSGAVLRVEGSPAAGDSIDVRAADDSFLGRGIYNPNSMIRCRLLTWTDEAIDQSFFNRRIQNAWRLRRRLFASEREENHDTEFPSTNAFRLINAEGDGLPGLIADYYAGHVVVQISAFGMTRFRTEIASGLQAIAHAQSVFERSSGAALKEEGMAPATQVLAGEEPPALIQMRENDLLFEVDVREGQKTGFYLDQRENRRWAARMAKGRRVLNCFSYSGAFSVYAAKAGAQRVVSVDSSHAAINQARKHFSLNGLEIAPDDFVAADAFHFLRATTSRFDFIILDPPAFAHRQKEVERAARAYKDVNLQAMKIIEPGGLILSCSCSQPVSQDLLQKILFGAAVDAGREVRILGHSGHAPDHPFSVYHPEGRYLQAFLLRVE